MSNYSFPGIVRLSEESVQKIAEQSLPEPAMEQDPVVEQKTPAVQRVKLPGVNPLVAKAVHEILEAQGGYPVIEGPDSVIILNNPPE